MTGTPKDIEYRDSVQGITEDQLEGFFVGWKKIPPPEVHLQALCSSGHVVLALDTNTNKVVGFISALTDTVMTAYIPLLEVLPSYQSKGIGTELVRRMLKKLESLYMVDLLCEADRQSFYEQFGMQKTTAMMLRNMHE